MAKQSSSKNSHFGDNIDRLVEAAVFAAEEKVRQENQQQIRKLAAERGAFPASIQNLYEAAGKGLYHHITVPAMNLRGLTYLMARMAFHAALQNRVGALIFEIARSEIGYTKQRPGEYAACVLAAAVKEGFQGPVFLQGDHFQVSLKKYSQAPEEETNAMRKLIQEAALAGFLNIDIDASTLVDLKKPTLEEQQEKNCAVTAEMTKFIRSIVSEGASISVGGEIGEVGKKNSTVEELRAFMTGYLSRLGPGIKGISKISVQTGTTHGGVVLPDGSIARVNLDFETLKQLSRVAREEYGMSGAVQHGASTLPDEAFSLFPEADTAEVHLATGFQNIVYDSPHFPAELREKIRRHLLEKYSDERKPDDTEEQFVYKTRKKAWGDLKREIWSIPEARLTKIGTELEKRFSLMFQKLNVVNTIELVNRYVTR